MIVSNTFQRSYISLLWRTKKYWLRCFSKKRHFVRPRTLLLLRLDGIGDYILFRNFIKALRESQKYKDYSITLCGNIVWKDAAEHLDHDEISDFIWIDKNRFNIINTQYYYNTLRKIRRGRYEVLIHPTYSRDRMADTIVKFSGAAYRIGNAGDQANLSEELKCINDTYYDELIPAAREVKFEFYRNAEFFGTLTGTTFGMLTPVININETTAPVPKTIILYIDASVENRRWHWSHFKMICEMLLMRYEHEIFLCGSSKAINENAETIMSLENGRLKNLVGKLSLYELILKMKTADLVVTHDTGAFHMAAALGQKVVCISNGHSIGRFHPYPDAWGESVRMVYPPVIDLKDRTPEELYETYTNRVCPDINSISPTEVLRVIETLIN